MFFTLGGWEFFVETIPLKENFLDWDLSLNENHIWVFGIHLIFNPVGEPSER